MAVHTTWNQNRRTGVSTEVVKSLQSHYRMEVSMGIENGNEIIPPFIEEPVQARPPDSERRFLSQATMFVGFVALTLALLGGVWLIWKVLDNGLMNNLELALVGMIPIGLAYMVGWIFSLISIRAYSNLVFPLVVRYYSWLTLTGVLVLYIKVIQKLFMQSYQFSNFTAYLMILVLVLLALFGLHLLPEDHDMRPFSIPIFLVGLLQLWIMIIRYVFFPVKGHGIYILGDLTIFAFMQTIAGLMLAHNGLFNPLRSSISEFFRDRDRIFR